MDKVFSDDNLSTKNRDDFFPSLNVICSDSLLTPGGRECVSAIVRHTDLPMLIPACVSCMGMLRVVQYGYSKCKYVCVCV